MLSRVQSGLLLLVDPDRRAQRGVTRVATELGLEVVTCDTARAGVNAACALEPVAIVTELELPDMDGYWFVAQIREQPTDVAACPIVVVTHEIDGSSRARTLRAGADVFLQKPIAASDLVAQVKALVDMVQRVRDRRGPLSWVGAPPRSVKPPADEAPAPRSVKPPPDEAPSPRSRRGPTKPPPEESPAPRSRRNATRPPPVKAAGPSAPPAARASKPPKAGPSKPPKAAAPARPPPVKVPPVRVPMFGSQSAGALPASGTPSATSSGPGASNAAPAAPKPLAAVPPAPGAPRFAPAGAASAPAPVASPPRPAATSREPLLPRAPLESGPRIELDEDDIIEAENEG